MAVILTTLGFLLPIDYAFAILRFVRSSRDAYVATMPQRRWSVKATVALWVAQSPRPLARLQPIAPSD